MPIRERKVKSGKVYEVRIQYRDRYGVTQNYSKSGFKTKRDAKDHESYILEQIRLKNDLSKPISIRELFNEQMDHDSSIADTTKQIRKTYYNKHLDHRIGDIKVDKIDYPLIQELFNELADELSKSTNENIAKLLNSLFRFAYNYKYINKLPYAKIVIRGKRFEKKKKTISDQDFYTVIDYIENKSRMKDSLRFKSYRIALYIGYYTGMRIGEVCALDRSDIDFNKKQISINKNLAILGNELIIKDTKTISSDAIIPLPSQLESILIDWFNEFDSEHVVVDNDLDYLSPNLIKGFLLNISRKYDMQFNFHMLRHTYTTNLWKNKVDPKIAQTLLRHKSYDTTMDIYTHLDNENLNDVVNKLFDN